MQSSKIAQSIAETLGIELLDNQGLIPDVVIVSTPPDKHIDIIKKYLSVIYSVACVIISKRIDKKLITNMTFTVAIF